jgi:hypothetical protein
LKNLIESQQILIQDFETISELSTFIARGTSFEAEEGSHDDLVMCLVLFSWCTSQNFFSELSDTNIKKHLHEEQMRQIENEMLPLPLTNVADEKSDSFVHDGAVWNIVQNEKWGVH